MTMSRLGWGLVLLAAAPAVSARASSPDPKDLAISAADRAKAAGLVRRLGSDEFREREQAERELAAMGRLARPALAAAGTDPSPEVRARVGRLLPKAEAADRRARLAAFAADKEGKYDHDLPGWAAFRERVGKGKAARELYAELIRMPANLDLLAAADGPAGPAGRAVADRRESLFVQFQPRAVPPQVPSAGDVAALLLAEAVVPGEEVRRHRPGTFVSAGYFLTTPSVAAALHTLDAESGPPLRKLVSVWLDSRTAANDLTDTMRVVQSFPALPGVVPMLKRAVTTPAVDGWAKGQALGSLIQRSGADEGRFLRSLLTDDTAIAEVPLGNNTQGGANRATCLLKDLALGILVLQGGQKLEEYGFDSRLGAVTTLQTPSNGSFTFAFATDEKRAAGFKKWADAEAARADKKGEKK